MKKPLIKKIIITIVILLVMCVIACGGSHIAAHYYANIGNLEMLSKALFVPEITKLFDPKIVNYSNAGQLLMQDHYLEAKPIFDELGQFYKSEELAMECSFREAKQLAYEEQNFEKSLDILAELDEKGFESATQEINKVLFNWAGYLLDEGDYITAYKLMLLIPDRSDIIEEATEAARKVVYIEGQKLYKKRIFYKARPYFETVIPYENSELYIELMDIRQSTYSDKEAVSIVQKLQSVYDFEDARELLMSDPAVACEFLRGTWRSSYGNMMLSINENNYLTTNLPRPYYGNFWWVVRFGVLKYSVSQNDNISNLMFKINVRTPKSIEIYCYQNKQTYTLYRQ